MHPYPKHGNADDRGCQNILLLILGEVTSLACCVTEQLNDNCKLQIANCQLQIVNCKLPIANCQLPISNSSC